MGICSAPPAGGGGGALRRQLAPGGKALRLDGVADGAARLREVAAVGEVTLGGEPLDVVEGGAGAIPEADFAQARGVEEEGAARQLDQLPGDRRVAAEAVLLPDPRRRLPPPALRRVVAGA